MPSGSCALKIILLLIHLGFWLELTITLSQSARHWNCIEKGLYSVALNYTSFVKFQAAFMSPYSAPWLKVLLTNTWERARHLALVISSSRSSSRTMSSSSYSLRFCVSYFCSILCLEIAVVGSFHLPPSALQPWGCRWILRCHQLRLFGPFPSFLHIKNGWWCDPYGSRHWNSPGEALVENRVFVAGGKGLLSRAVIRDKEGAIKGPPFVADRLPPATYSPPCGRRGARRG
jgi:hypothetical protein